MSKPPPPGYWQASDGKWYPPTAAPATQLPPPPAPSKSTGNGCAAVIVLVALIVVGAIVVGVISGGDDDEPDGGAQLACRHFRNVANDYSDGVLTLGELREKLKEVEDDARVSEEPGVASAARELLAAATALDAAAMVPAIERLDQACTQAGV